MVAPDLAGNGWKDRSTGRIDGDVGGFGAHSNGRGHNHCGTISLEIGEVRTARVVSGRVREFGWGLDPR